MQIGKNESLKYLNMSKNEIKSLYKEFQYVALHRNKTIEVEVDKLQ